jgi:pimeloyl-ACP methyl ester carboxylesterase
MTYVLIPGAGGDSWYWHLVAPLLDDCVAVDLPAADESAGLHVYADAIAAAAGDRAGVTLVAQSMGAFSATMACERLDVAQLLLVVPMIPAPGETPGGWWSASGQTDAMRENELREGRDPDAPFDVMTAFFHDVPQPIIDAAFARGEPRQADRPMVDPWPLSSWPAVTTRVLAGRRDRLLPLPFMQHVTKQRIGVEPDVVDAGHLPALVRPREVAAWIRNGH